jgi:hypothetical protein
MSVDHDPGLVARAEMAVRGVAVEPDGGSRTLTDLGTVIPLRRPGGAGPSADGHVLVAGDGWYGVTATARSPTWVSWWTPSPGPRSTT